MSIFRDYFILQHRFIKFSAVAYVNRYKLTANEFKIEVGLFTGDTFTATFDTDAEAGDKIHEIILGGHDG